LKSVFFSITKFSRSVSESYSKLINMPRAARRFSQDSNASQDTIARFERAHTIPISHAEWGDQFDTRAPHEYSHSENIVERTVPIVHESLVRVERPVPYPVDRPVPYPVEHTVSVPYDHPVPYPVEKIVEVPYTVERDVPYPVDHPVPYPVERIVEVKVDRPVPVAVDRPRPYPVKRQIKVPVDRPVPYPVERIVEVPVDHPVPYPVEKIVEVPVDRPRPYPVDRPVPYPVEKIVEVKVPYPVDRPVVQERTITVEKPVPYPVPTPVETTTYIGRPVAMPMQITEEIITDDWSESTVCSTFVESPLAPALHGTITEEITYYPPRNETSLAASSVSIPPASGPWNSTNYYNNSMSRDVSNQQPRKRGLLHRLKQKLTGHRY
jgi:hypothetical protein